jgi:hypothetical protein
MEAVLCNHTKMVKLLLDVRANVNAQDQLGKTALMEASFKGHTELVELLLMQMSIYKTKLVGLPSFGLHFSIILKWWSYYWRLMQMSTYKIKLARLLSCMPQIKAILKWWNYYVQRLLLLIQRLLTPLSLLLTPLSLLLTPLLGPFKREMSLALHLALDSMLLLSSAPIYSFSPFFTFSKLKMNMTVILFHSS